jgi:hypothetical protein
LCERTRPVAGIGFGQAGYWGNRHFSTVELAEASYERYAAEIRASYSTQFSGKFIEVAIKPVGTLIKGVRFINLKKNGKPGKIVHTVHLYKIEEAVANRYMASLWYTPEA